MKAVVLAAGMAMLLAACGNEGTAGDSTSMPSGMAGMSHGPSVTPIAERPSTDAVLKIVSPNDGDVLDGNVDIQLELHGARIVQQTSTDLRPDEGHIHVLLDDQLISMTSGLTQTLHDVAPGLHVLKVEFVANDHAPFDPRVIDAVAFEVESP